MATTGRELPFDAVFRPRRVAVVGASDRSGSPGDVLWRNLAGFDGEVVPVSRTAAAVHGVPAYPRLTDVPGRLDLVVVAVPAQAAVEVVQDASAAGVRAAVVVSAGFAEAGPEGGKLQTELVAAAEAGDMVLVGPNCLGVQNLVTGLNASLAASTGRGGPGVSLITQSGSYAMGVAAVSDEDGGRFALVLSTGNQAALTDHEALAGVAADPATRVVCLFVEGLRDGQALLPVLRQVTRQVPVVVAMVGTSPDGARAAASHTAALAADRRVWRDVLTASGAVVAAHGLEMLDAARALADQPVPAGARVALVTNSGGMGTELADLLAAEGLSVPELSPSLQADLAALLPPYGSPRNPVDVTPAWSRFTQMYPAAVDLLARSGEVDVVIPVLVHRAADLAVTTALADTTRKLSADGVPVPVYVCWVAPSTARPARAPLDDVGVPAFPWPARTARAVGHAVRYGRVRETVGEGQDRTPAPDSLLDDGVVADPEGLQGLLTAAGIPVVRGIVCADVADAEPAARELGYPLVAKVVHPDLSHKTDAGGVVLGLRDLAEAREAVARLLALRDGATVLLQPQVEGIELLLGAWRDPTFGPVVAAGAGGVLVELVDDVRFAPAPLTAAEARRLIASTRAGRLLDGVRGGPALDAQAVAEVLVRLGDVLVRHPQLREIELNPVLVTPAGPVAVDLRAGMSQRPHVRG